MKKVQLLLVGIISGVFVYAQVPGITWQKSLGGTGAEEAKTIQPTSDGGYIVGGTTSSNDGDVTGNHGGKDCWVVKLNAAGSIEWQKTYGGTGDEIFGSIRVTADGGYIMGAGTGSNDGDVSGSHGYGEAWVVKLNSAGTIEWQKCFGSSGGDYLDYIEQTFDGGYICKGGSGTNDGDLAGQSTVGGGWIFKLNSSREIQWQKAFYTVCTFCGGTLINFIRQTNDNGYIYSGYTPGGITSSTFITKVNSGGIYVGGESFSSQGQPDISAAVPTNDSGCVSVYLDNSTYSTTIRKYSKTMSPEWTSTLPIQGAVTSNIVKTPDNGFLITGYSSGYSPNNNLAGSQGDSSDYWLAKLNGTGNIVWQRLLGSAGADIANWGECLTDSSYIVAGKGVANSGEITGNHGGDDFWVVKLPKSSPNFAIISSAGAGGSINPNGGILYPSGINQPFKIKPYPNYHIANVLVDGVSNTAAISSGTHTFTNLTTSHTISATFAIDTYTISASAGPNGSISPIGNSTVNYGNNKAYTITPAPGYSVLDVIKDGVSLGAYSTYTFNDVRQNHTIRAIFANLDSASAFVCSPGDSATITSNITGTNYNWQVNAGNGFVRLYDNINYGNQFQNINYGGTTTTTLTIRNYPSSYFGYKYRCVVDEGGSYEFTLKFKNTWAGTFGNNWEIPQNWSCGRIPDANTDVIIPAGTNLIISTNITIRSLSLGTGANVTLAPGGNLVVLH